MKNIQEVVDYIDNHIEDIEMFEHNLAPRWHVSIYYLNRSFKKHTGTTLRDYLLERKVEQIEKIVDRNPDISFSDLKDETRFSCGDKTFRKYISLAQKSSTSPIHSYLGYSRNREIVSEILVRLILLLNEAEPIFRETCCDIIHPVENKIFQFIGWLPADKAHYYKVFFSLYDQSLSFELVGAQRIINEEYLYQPNTIIPYLTLLHSVNEKIKKKFPFSLTQPIKDWEKYVTPTGTISWLGGISHEIDVDLKNLPVLEIDRNAPFIQETDNLIENIRMKLFETCKQTFLSLYGIPYEVAQTYTVAVRENKYEEIRKVLHRINNWNNSEILALFFELTDCPYCDNNLLDGISYKEGLEILTGHSKEEIINLLIAYREKYVSLPEEEYDDFDFSTWLKDHFARRTL